MDDTSHTLAAVLVQAKLLEPTVAQEYLQAARAKACRFLDYIVKQSNLCPVTIAQCLARHFDLPYLDLQSIELHALPLNLLTPSILHHHVLPIACHANQLQVAVDDPSAQRIFDEIQFSTQSRILPSVVSTTQLTQLIDKILQNNEHQNLSNYANTQNGSLSALLRSDTPDEAPIVAFVQSIFRQALAHGASDLHFEPYADQYRIRYRKDGILYELTTPPLAIASRIAARLKILADLDIAERRLPQDGRFSFVDKQNRSIDCRLSTCPTVHGEKIAIRLLNTHTQALDLSQLGLTTQQQGCLQQALAKPQGLILVTGPTGSGKTITLYAALQHMNSAAKNISTIEDPVEIQQTGINQIQINPKIDLNFSIALRALLRQDPDVIMVGEIRDVETADIAMRSAQTGHLVLSTLHTKNSVETIVRLQQLGAAPYLIATSVTLIVAQRLARKLCAYCKKPAAIGYQAVGCHRCDQGFSGRIGIFEVLPMSSAIQHQLRISNVDTDQLTQQAKREGMLTLYEASMQHVHHGVIRYEDIQIIL